MAYRKEDLKKVKQAFSEKRNRAFGEAKTRLDQLHREYPDLSAIDSALAMTGMRLVEEITKGSDGITERVAAVRRENEKLQEDRASMLAFYGYPADYTDVKYECKSCEDTGYTGTAMCACMKKALARQGLETAGLARLADTQRFDTFDLRYYEGGQRDTMETILSFSRSYAESFSEGSESILFIGNTGLGKTHMTTAIAVTAVEKGYDVLYHSAPNIFSSLEAEKFGRETRLTMVELLDATLLIIDDLGTENPSALNVNFLYNIINTRMIERKPTIINTNLMPAELMKRYTDRLASRLLGEYTVLRFVGNDIRMQKLQF